MPERAVRLLLCGDVMTGRGVDQILPHPGEPALRESYVRDARRYVELAEALNGPIPRPVDFSWPWGDALRTIEEMQPDARLVNLETSITRSDEYDAAKAVHYRMHPDNMPCLTAARIDVCALANNHVLDFAHRGLAETVGVLAQAGIQPVGAGKDATDAWRPAMIDVGAGRIVVFSFGMPSSGVPATWAATPDRPGVSFARGRSDDAVADLLELVRQGRRRNEIVVASVHWGSNWGYDVPSSDVRLAHRLIDGGVDVVHGHSSHHPRPIEVYRDKLVLYGCGDLIDDYEGIRGYERYRDDLRLLYFVTVDVETGRLSTLRITALQARKMRLHHASPQDRDWVRSVLDRISRPFRSRIGLEPDGTLALEPRG